MLFSSLQEGLLILMKCWQSAKCMTLHQGLCYTLSVVSLSASSLCPPCASAFLARRSSERGWWLLHVLIPGHCELPVGLIFLLGHQRVTWGSGELGQG